MNTELIFWIAFAFIIVVSLAVDLGITNKKSHILTFRQAGTWTLIWVSFALFFALALYFFISEAHSIDFGTAYLLELSLSVDNLFVFILIFKYFKIPPHLQHRILFWGVFGAIVFRALFIYFGIVLISHFHWLLLVFSLFLIYMGIKLALEKETSEQDFSKSWILKFSKKIFNVVPEFHGNHFFVKLNSKFYATPMMVALVSVELTDIAFAIDSVPVVLAVTSDPLVVFTSNIFAIMGLRSMYFLLVNVIERLRYLKYGLGVILTFVGVKILIAEFAPSEWKISSPISFMVIFSVLFISGIASYYVTKREGRTEKRK